MKLVPLRIQIMNLIYTYIERSYSLSYEICLNFFNTMTAILASDHENVLIRLLTLRTLIPLCESNADLVMNLEMVMKGVLHLMVSVKDNTES